MGKTKLTERREREAGPEADSGSDGAPDVLEVIAITNNLATFAREGLHNVSVILRCVSFEGEPTPKEPEKCEGWGWYPLDALPAPMFEGSLWGIRCHLAGKVFLPESESDVSTGAPRASR